MSILYLFLLLFSLTSAFEHNCVDVKRTQTTFIYDEKVHKSLFISLNRTQNLSIDIILGNGYNRYHDAGDVFKLAARIWEEVLRKTQTSAPIFISTNFGRLTPGTIGESESTNVIFSCFSDQVDVMMREMQRRTGIVMPQCYRNLNFMLPEWASYQRGFDIDKAHLKALAVRDTDQYFGRNDANIVFSTRFLQSFDFDLSDGIDPRKTDFFSVALHEIGHVLGFRSGIGKIDHGGFGFNPTILDIYRFSSFEKIDFLNTFRVADGREDHYIINPLVSSMNRRENQFSTGDLNGDGNPPDHYKDDKKTGVTLGIFDPTLGHKHLGLTRLDMIMMKMLGYSVNIAVKPEIIAAQITFSDFRTNKRAIKFIAEFVFSEDLECIINEGAQYSVIYDEETGNYLCPYNEEMPRFFKIKGVLTLRESDVFAVQ